MDNREQLQAISLGGDQAAVVPPASAPFIDRKALLRQDRRYWCFRRIQDVVLSLIALIALFPFMLLIALIIWIDSPGANPVYTQERVGKDGKRFKFRKFRTMVPNADELLDDLIDQNEMIGPAFKIKNDPRITRIGKFLRKTSIDELPQLINILAGEMSIVGPRPPLPREVAQYGEYELQRLYVTPGLTCYWQIQPHRNSMTFEEWLELDLKYIQDRSFLVDWRIILSTFGAVIGMNGE